MGIIEKQATKNTIYSYLGAGLGFFTVTWISHLLSSSQNGAIKLLISYTALFAQFANLGFATVTIRLFPYFKNKEKGHHGFLFYALIVTLIGLLLGWILFYFLKNSIIDSNQGKSPLFTAYLFYLIPLTFFTVFFTIFDVYLRACFSSVIGSFAKEFVQRILILLLLAVYFFEYINFNVFIFLYITFTCLPTIILLFYIIRNDEWHVKPTKGFLTKQLKTEIIKLSTYSILAGGAGAIIQNVDVIMINQKLGEKVTGIYGIAFYFGSIILIPARSITRITSSIVAEHFKTNDFVQIKKLYAQSCNTQMAIGILLFIGIVVNIDNIMHLLPKEYYSGKYVILILSAGYLVEMATGLNQVILLNSEYYRYDTYFVFLLVIITVIANYIFIPLYQITGAAVATAATVILANILRYGFLLKKYKMQPYDFNSIKLILIGLIAIVPGIIIPYLNNMYLDIIVRSTSVGGVFILLMLKWEAATELNKKIRKNLKRFSISI